MLHPNQEEQRKEEHQILKDKQQVNKKEKKKMFDTKSQNEKGKIRTRKSRRHKRKKRKIKYIAHCINFVSFSVTFKLRGLHPIEFNYEKKNWKAMIRLMSLIVHVDTDDCYVRERWIIREKKEGKKREKRRDVQACQFVITKPLMW